MRVFVSSAYYDDFLDEYYVPYKGIFSWRNWVLDITKSNPTDRKLNQLIPILDGGGYGFLHYVPDEIHDIISEYDYKYCYRVDVGGRGDKIWSYMKKNGNATKSPTYLDYAIVMDIDKEDLVNIVLKAQTEMQLVFVDTLKSIFEEK